MTEPTVPATVPPVWLPDLSAVPLREQPALDLAAAREQLLARVARPMSTVAGSEGS